MTPYSACCRHVTFSSTSRTLLVRDTIHHPAKMHHNGYAEREINCCDWHVFGQADSHKDLAKRATLNRSATFRSPPLSRHRCFGASRGACPVQRERGPPLCRVPRTLESWRASSSSSLRRSWPWCCCRCCSGTSCTSWSLSSGSWSSCCLASGSSGSDAGPRRDIAARTEHSRSWLADKAGDSEQR